MLSNNESKVVTRWGDPVAGVLLLAALLIAGARLMATDWIPDLNIIPIVCLLGGLAGLALGYSRFSTRIVLLFVMVYGLFAIFWQLGSTMERGIPWLERTTSLIGRFENTIIQLLRGQDVNDSILFLIAMAFLFWILSIHAGYSLFRHGDPWSAILPIGAAMFIIHINDKFWPFRAWYLGIYLLLGLMLVARMTYLKLRADWKKNRTRTPSYIGLDMSRAALIASVPLILIAWTAPALAMSLPSAQAGWQEISQPFRNQFDHLFASLRATVGIVGDYYSDTLALGRGNELSDVVVLTVEAPTVLPAGARYYWKARTYDAFTGFGWDSTISGTEEISPEIFNLLAPSSPYRYDASVSFAVNIPLRTIHTVSETYSVSRPGSASAVVNSDGSLDIHSLSADPYLRSGEQYQLQAALTSATIKDLRESGTEYPDWVTQRYLQLPDSISERTRTLAQAVVEGIDNPYDQTVAITNFLRENIVYTDRIEIPPGNQDIVDWLLFDYRQGFCNYYATAEVVLLRSLGIPARMAVGYAEGERRTQIDAGAVPDQQGIPPDQLEPLVSDISTYIVRQRDLHAWPEVYFPGIGWVEFEPTANQAPLFRPSGDPLSADGTGGANEEPLPDDDLGLGDASQDTSALLPDLTEPTQSQIILGIVIRIAAVIAAIGLLGFALWGIRRRLPPEPIPVQLESRMRKMGLKPPRLLTLWSRRAALPPLTKAYLEINRALRRLGKSPGQADTPAERVSSLNLLIPAAAEPANYLLEEYHAHMYSSHPANGEKIAREAGKRIRSLSLWAWFNRLISRWQEPESKRRR
jgi:transglutaminase-like putative cysteine protease